MAVDPLRIIGKPAPTPAERAAAENLARQTGRPPKLCRAALLQARHDVPRATALLRNKKFLRMNQELDVEVVATRFVTADDVETDQGAQIDDAAFGRLRWDGMWEGQLEAPGFGHLGLSVEPGDGHGSPPQPPSEPQRTAMREFLAAAEGLRVGVERANFDYFLRVRPEYEQAGAAVPAVATARDLSDELGPARLHIPSQPAGAWRVELLWECSWDPEHGHAVLIDRGGIVHVGLQGEGWPD